MCFGWQAGRVIALIPPSSSSLLVLFFDLLEQYCTREHSADTVLKNMWCVCVVGETITGNLRIKSREEESDVICSFCAFVCGDAEEYCSYLF